jgi:Mn-dependent DtxR family transcriptional regulator
MKYTHIKPKGRPKGAKSRARDVLLTIQDHINAEGGSPSIGQIAKSMEMAKATVHWYVLRLEEDGYITRSTDHRKLISVTGMRMK